MSTLIAMSAAPEIEALGRLVAGQQIPFGGDRVVRVGTDLAHEFVAGDRLVVVQSTGALLHIPAAVHALVDRAVTEAHQGFAALAGCSDDQISDFFDRFAASLDDDTTFDKIATANVADVNEASSRRRSTTRLVLDATMREAMVAGLRGWRDSPSRRDGTIGRIQHARWSVEARRAPLGVVGFVFEGRPNVFADACGVVRTGNSVVFRIGSDALRTANAIVEHALAPSLRDSGLPPGVVRLVDSPTHAAGYALFGDGRLALAVARGSGPAVVQLGAVASQAGTSVSLHGTGGAWMIVGGHADAAVLQSVVTASLDRKVCNTLNVCAIVRERASELIPAFLAGLDAAAAERGESARLHVVAGGEDVIVDGRLDRSVTVRRADGDHVESAATVIDIDGLAIEWEWENSPELTLVMVDSVDEGADLCNRYSAHFVASMISDDPAEQSRFYERIDAPFVGDGFTRWVDGQYALDAPELGLSNWQTGRTLGRGAILSGDSIHTVRYRAAMTDASLRR